MRSAVLMSVWAFLPAACTNEIPGETRLPRTTGWSGRVGPASSSRRAAIRIRGRFRWSPNFVIWTATRWFPRPWRQDLTGRAAGSCSARPIWRRSRVAVPRPLSAPVRSDLPRRRRCSDRVPGNRARDQLRVRGLHHRHRGAGSLLRLKPPGVESAQASACSRLDSSSCGFRVDGLEL